MLGVLEGNLRKLVELRLVDIGLEVPDLVRNADIVVERFDGVDASMGALEGSFVVAFGDAK